MRNITLMTVVFMLVVQKSFALIIYVLITFPCFNPHLSVINGTFHEIRVYGSDNEGVECHCE